MTFPMLNSNSDKEGIMTFVFICTEKLKYTINYKYIQSNYKVQKISHHTWNFEGKIKIKAE